MGQVADPRGPSFHPTSRGPRRHLVISGTSPTVPPTGDSPAGDRASARPQSRISRPDVLTCAASRPTLTAALSSPTFRPTRTTTASWASSVAPAEAVVRTSGDAYVRTPVPWRLGRHLHPRRRGLLR